MKQLILTLWFVLIFSTPALAQTQIVTEDPALAGCKIFIEDGLIYGVCNGERTVDHVYEHKEVQEPVVQEPVIREPERKKQEVKWTCVVGPCDFIDENGNLKS